MDPYYFYYLSKFVIVDFVGKTANSIQYSMPDIETLNYYSKENLKHLFKNFKLTFWNWTLGYIRFRITSKLMCSFLTTFLIFIEF